MGLNYIIVQAGGKGTRMENLTRNKPKALVPVNNLPMLFHLFRKYPQKKFIIIGDYKYDVLEKYCHSFADVDYQMVSGRGHTGTCAGMREALSYIPNNERFMLIWCDLVLPDDYVIPESTQNIIGISKDFPCRWKYEKGEFIEESSTEHGVAGHFIFKDKSFLKDIPEDGEFVKWLQGKEYIFVEQPLYKTHEYGLYSEWDKLPKIKCRPFNSMEIKGDKLYKMPIDDQGRMLAKREIAWYKKLQGTEFDNIPKIFEYNPLCMEYIDGKNIYEYTDIPIEKKREMLSQIIDCLRKVHNLESSPADVLSYRIAYLDKTYERLKKVKNLVPFATEKNITINGKVCRNIFFHKDEVEKMVMQYLPSEFKLIHGDCTFSNIMLTKKMTPMLIDPRGYFGNTEYYGDPAYDWVKIYYSLYSNYDQFNLKRFNLFINQSHEENIFNGHDGDVNVKPLSVQINVASNHWEELETYFFELLDKEVTRDQMKLFLAITWLSLTTYAWEDYDSICGAFYIGLYYLEEVLN